MSAVSQVAQVPKVPTRDYEQAKLDFVRQVSTACKAVKTEKEDREEKVNALFDLTEKATANDSKRVMDQCNVAYDGTIKLNQKLYDEVSEIAVRLEIAKLNAERASGVVNQRLIAQDPLKDDAAKRKLIDPIIREMKKVEADVARAQKSLEILLDSISSIVRFTTTVLDFPESFKTTHGEKPKVVDFKAHLSKVVSEQKDMLYNVKDLIERFMKRPDEVHARFDALHRMLSQDKAFSLFEFGKQKTFGKYTVAQVEEHWAPKLEIKDKGSEAASSQQNATPVIPMAPQLTTVKSSDKKEAVEESAKI